MNMANKQKICKKCNKKFKTNKGKIFCPSCNNKISQSDIIQREYLEKKQNNKCAICNKEETIFYEKIIDNGSFIKNKKIKKSLSFDHDHKTGYLRGLLCHNCNSLLGNCNDDIKILLSAINYLMKYNKEQKNLTNV